MLLLLLSSTLPTHLPHRYFNPKTVGLDFEVSSS
jgi:hypothetical protein